jgi:hypothetical protein
VECFDTTGKAVRALSAGQAFPIEAQYSWAQLHLGPEAVDAVIGQPIVFFASDGQHFHQISLPSGGGAVQSLTADATGFVLSTDNSFGQNTTVFRSADGRHWTAYPLPAADNSVMGAGSVGGQLLAVAGNGSASQILELQGATWVPLSVPGLSVPAGGNQSLEGVAFGPLGIAVAVQNTDGDSSDNLVLYSPNGVTWSTSDLDTLAGGQVAQVANVAVGTNEVVVTVERPATPSAGIEVGTKTAEVAIVGTAAGS